MTTTTRSIGPRVDSPVEFDRTPQRAYFQRTFYPHAELWIHTTWWNERWHTGPSASTVITETLTGLPGALYRKDYDPAHVTIGGLAEAHEAVCARVERGELP